MKLEYPSMLMHDGRRDRQAQSCASTVPLSGKKGIDDLVPDLLRDTYPLISHFQYRFIRHNVMPYHYLNHIIHVM